MLPVLFFTGYEEMVRMGCIFGTLGKDECRHRRQKRY